MSATKTVEIKGWIVFDAYYAKNPDIWPCPYRFTDIDFSEGIKVKPHTLTVEVPADFDPRPGLVQGLEAKRRQLQAEFTKRVTEIEAEISKLQALEFTEAA